MSVENIIPTPQLVSTWLIGVAQGQEWVKPVDWPHLFRSEGWTPNQLGWATTGPTTDQSPTMQHGTVVFYGAIPTHLRHPGRQDDWVTHNIHADGSSQLYMVCKPANGKPALALLEARVNCEQQDHEQAGPNGRRLSPEGVALLPCAYDTSSADYQIFPGQVETFIRHLSSLIFAGKSSSYQDFALHQELSGELIRELSVPGLVGVINLCQVLVEWLDKGRLTGIEEWGSILPNIRNAVWQLGIPIGQASKCLKCQVPQINSYLDLPKAVELNLRARLAKSIDTLDEARKDKAPIVFSRLAMLEGLGMIEWPTDGRAAYDLMTILGGTMATYKFACDPSQIPADHPLAPHKQKDSHFNDSLGTGASASEPEDVGSQS